MSGRAYVQLPFADDRATVRAPQVADQVVNEAEGRRPGAGDPELGDEKLHRRVPADGAQQSAAFGPILYPSPDDCDQEVRGEDAQGEELAYGRGGRPNLDASRQQSQSSWNPVQDPGCG